MPLRNFKKHFGVICAWVNKFDSLFFTLFYFGTYYSRPQYLRVWECARLLYMHISTVLKRESTVLKKPVNYNDLHICSFFSLTRRLSLFIIQAFIFSSILGPVRIFPYETACLIPQVCVDWALNRLVERFKKRTVSVGALHWMVSWGRRPMFV